jgi:hypothetical protein
MKCRILGKDSADGKKVLHEEKKLLYANVSMRSNVIFCHARIHLSA